jgi:hypothetical protein
MVAMVTGCDPLRMITSGMPCYVTKMNEKDAMLDYKHAATIRINILERVLCKS